MPSCYYSPLAYHCLRSSCLLPSFFSKDPPPPEIYTLSLHDALPICLREALLLLPHRLGHPRLRLPDLRIRLAHHRDRSEEHTSELQSLRHLVCRLLLEKKKAISIKTYKHHTCNKNNQSHTSGHLYNN